uniref:Uncharacterized protein n=1 Tax=Anopheles atroparvus TaxID=41427 RepID=A0AAG5DW21_ANOAO
VSHTENCQHSAEARDSATVWFCVVDVSCACPAFLPTGGVKDSRRRRRRTNRRRRRRRRGRRRRRRRRRRRWRWRWRF